MSSPDDPTPIGDELDRVLRSFGAPSARGLRTLFDDWEEVVGPQLAGHCRPSGIDGTTLLLTVEDPAWASELRWLEEPLLERISDGIGPGVVTAVRLRIDRDF